MTHAEIDDLKPSRQLNVLVAKHLGWKWYRNNSDCLRTLMFNPADRLIRRECDDDSLEPCVEYVPNYSNDDMLALKMLGEYECRLTRDHLHELRQDWNQRGDALNWEVAIVKRELPCFDGSRVDGEPYCGIAPTLAHAFCLAMLKTEKA